MSDKQSIYHGKPENQKNPSAINARLVSKNQNQGKKNVLKVPPTLPPPSHLHDASHVKFTEKHPAESAIFSQNMTTREVDGRVNFTPSTPVIIDITRDTYAQLQTDESNLSKVLLPECLDYYATALLWFRIVSLKIKNQQVLTDLENQVLLLIEKLSFCVPEPLFLQLRVVGNLVTHTGQHLYPEFPPLPVEVTGAFGGYYGPINLNNHNLYEEIPCLGVVSEALRQSISDAAPGAYASAIALPDQPCNGNLLGFRPLGHRRDEAKTFSARYGITANQFACNPPNSMINIGFLLAISDQLSSLKTFKNTHVCFSSFSELGGSAQSVIQIPLVLNNILCSQGEVRVSSLAKVTTSVLGSGAFFLPQLRKEPHAADHNTWSCITVNDAHPLQQDWIDNRNIRRNLPAQYHIDVFTSVSIDATIHRASIIRSLVLKTR